MMCTNHPTIIKFIGYSKLDFLEENNVTVIMQLAPNGSLSSVIKSIMSCTGPHDYSNTSRQMILVGVARGMKYLHDRGVIHRDLKAGNILLGEDFRPLITDFGMSKFVESGHSKSQSQYGGTLSYEAPEILKGEKYDGKVDVYSFGILMFEIVNDCFAYPDLINGKISHFVFLSKVVNENYRPKFEFPVNDSLKKLIEECWLDDPNKRPTFEEIFNKLSGQKGEDQKVYFISDDVDPIEFNLYIDDITEINDSTEKLLHKISKIEEENQNYLKKIEEIENKNQQLEKVINESKNIKDLTIIGFNNLPIESQLLIFESKEIPTNKIQKLANYLQQFELKSESHIEIFDSNEVNLLDMKEIRICINSNITKSIILSKKFDIKSFLSIINLVDEFCFELKYPSKSYNEIYKKVLEIKNKSTSDQNKITISIFISGIKETDQTFCENKDINYIILDEGILTIKYDESWENYGSFGECSSLLRVKIANSTTSIEDTAFFNCSSLTQITIPPSVKTIGSDAFYGCSSLTQITIPSSVKTIGSDAFYGCSSLKQITIPPSVNIINDRSFNRCRSLISIMIPSSVTKIEDNAFTSCVSLSQVSFESLSSLKSIGSGAFSRCISLMSISIPSSVLKINNNAFSGCSSLIKIEIPSSVTKIGESAFEFCSSLLKVSFENPSSVKSIGDCAFKECSSLLQITIPSSVTEIGSEAFRECSSLLQVSFEKPSSLTSIGQYAFSECTSLFQIAIPSSLTSIDNDAFSLYSSISQISIPSSIKSIGVNAFRGCKSISSLFIPSSVISINKNAFYECSSLSEILFESPSSLIIIGEYSFANCSSLKQISIPPSVNSIGKDAFILCSSLSNVSFESPSSIKSIGNDAFSRCSSSLIISIPPSLTPFKNIFPKDSEVKII